MLNGLSNVDKREGYGPYDDLDAIPRVLKEKPVYMRGSAGVTLRSARFDNNVGLMEEGEEQSASGYFSDSTQRRMVQILAEMNVQVPRMATGRICDTLDRLKQDIVRLILLRVMECVGSDGQKYFAQNDYKPPVSSQMMYPNTDTKVRN